MGVRSPAAPPCPGLSLPSFKAEVDLRLPKGRSQTRRAQFLKQPGQPPRPPHLPLRDSPRRSHRPTGREAPRQARDAGGRLGLQRRGRGESRVAGARAPHTQADPRALAHAARGLSAHAPAPQSRQRTGSSLPRPRPAGRRSPPPRQPRPSQHPGPATASGEARSRREPGAGSAGAGRRAEVSAAAAGRAVVGWARAGRALVGCGPRGWAAGSGLGSGLGRRPGLRSARLRAAPGGLRATGGEGAAAGGAEGRAAGARRGRAASRGEGGGAEGRRPAHGPAGPGAPDAAPPGPSPRCRPRPGRDDADGAATRRRGCRGSRPPGPRGLALRDWPSGRREAGAWGASRAAPCRPRCGSRSWSSCSWTGPGATRAP